MSIILAQKWKHFRADFEKFQEMCEKLNYRNKFSTKQSLESLPEVFLTGEPNTNKKKQLLGFSSLRMRF